MALLQTNTAVQTTATKIVQLPTGMQYSTVTIYNGSAGSIYVGGASVTTSGTTRGVVVATATSLVLALNAGDALYAVAASATSAGDIVVLYSGI